MSGILNLLLGSAAGVIKDAYFNLVTLLLNTTATNGAQNNTFLDSSTNNFSITRNGNATQGTFTPFSQTGWSNYFPSAAYFTVPNNAVFNLGSNDFTIECWYYQTLDTTGASLVSQWQSANDANSSWQLMASSSTNTPQFTFNVTSPVSITSSTATALNTWYHLAAVRNGGTITLYLNGVSVASSSVSGSIRSVTNPVGIAARGGSTNDSQFPGGYISNARVVNGTAVYTAAFTPPTIPLTAITNTVLLTSQSNRFVDNSTTALTITLGGTPSVQAFSPFAPDTAYSTSLVGGSGYFDGSGDYLTFTDSANNLDLGGLVASFEAWVYPTSAAAGQHFAYKHGGAFSWSASNGIEYAIAFDVNKFYLVYNNGGSPAFINGAATRQPYQWHHVVVATDASNNIALFVNGVREGTATNAITKPTTRTTITIGANVSGAEPIFGYVSGQRFIKGSGAYDPTQSTITVPTAPPTAVTNTQLLLNYTNAGIYDAAAKNDLETVGNAQVSTTQAKFGTTSMYFDGTGDYLLLPKAPILDGISDFTIEYWQYPIIGVNGQYVVLGSAEGSFSGNASSFVYVPTNGQFNGYISTSLAFTYTPPVNIYLNTWTHVAYVRNGSGSNNCTLYLNGVAVATGTNTTALNLNSTNSNTLIGKNGWDPTFLFTGYLDELRITRYARYTANFTPPAAAFPIQ